MQETQYFDAPVTDVIKNRTSVRTYKPLILPADIIRQLEAYARWISGPFDRPVRFVFWDDASFEKETGGKIGTYGIIRGSKHYIAGIVKKGDKDLEQLGYVFQQLILYATSLGLGTCWLGGTFRRTSLERAAGLQEGEILPVITPVGYQAGKESMLSRAMKLASRSRERKPWKELFFLQSLDRPLEENEAGDYSIPLEMVRLAPSASNKQPWRVFKSGRFWHFYLDYSRLTNRSLGFEIQRIDMGIALCHFELTAREAGLPGHWVTHAARPSNPGADKLHYIVTWHDSQI